MILRHTFLPGRAGLGFFVALFSLLLSMSLLVSPARAAAVGCRFDPIITLSNGDTVVITADIAAAPDDVKQIKYTLHVPARVTVTNVVYTGDGLGVKEKLSVKDDAPAGTYVTETLVKTDAVVAVTATSSKDNLSVVVVGLSNSTLRAVLAPPEN